MNGATNAAPAAGGGLKVIASGDYELSGGSESVTFSSAPSVVIVTVSASTPFGTPDTAVLYSGYATTCSLQGVQTSLSGNRLSLLNADAGQHATYLALG